MRGERSRLGLGQAPGTGTPVKRPFKTIAYVLPGNCRYKKIWEDDKPDPVANVYTLADNHSSRDFVTEILKRSLGGTAETVSPHFDLASDRVYRPSGLPEWGRSIRPAFHPIAKRIRHGLLSVTLSVALRPPVFHWYPLLQSPDFPLLPN